VLVQERSAGMTMPSHAYTALSFARNSPVYALSTCAKEWHGN
jgi:hypothetical protein